MPIDPNNHHNTQAKWDNTWGLAEVYAYTTAWPAAKVSQLYMRYNGKWLRGYPVPRGLPEKVDVLGFTSTLPFGTNSAAGVVQVTHRNGLPPFTYSWERISGSTALTILSPSETRRVATILGTSFTLGPQIATFRVTVTDVNGDSFQAETDATVHFNSGESLNGDISPISILVNQQWLDSAFTITTPPVVCTAAGGTGLEYTYSWVQIAGNTSISITSPNAASTTFSAEFTQSEQKWGTFKCVLNDSGGNGPEDSNQNVSILMDAWVEVVPPPGTGTWLDEP